MGVDGAGLKVSAISLCMMDVARGPGHLKCTKQDGAKHALLAAFFSISHSATDCYKSHIIRGFYCLSVERHKQELGSSHFVDLLQITLTLWAINDSKTNYLLIVFANNT